MAECLRIESVLRKYRTSLAPVDLGQNVAIRALWKGDCNQFREEVLYVVF